MIAAQPASYISLPKPITYWILNVLLKWQEIQKPAVLVVKKPQSKLNGYLVMALTGWSHPRQLALRRHPVPQATRLAVRVVPGGHFLGRVTPVAT
jgi:hypothetical protein